MFHTVLFKYVGNCRCWKHGREKEYVLLVSRKKIHDTYLLQDLQDYFLCSISLFSYQLHHHVGM